MTQNNESLRECVHKIEEKLRSIVGDCIGKWFATPHRDYEYEQLVELCLERLSYS